ncbi:hypothetical protein BO221_17260 [Archangium sp. Cb G35]|uniref:DUF2378 family protein n=1 Tax=Archangium sp. Cb G35 TaxID=1920190 RepID=UPI000936C0F0|nr:DUF2378 family protein [Archangium sp. Cb G35]OJT23729.1 hypothetical protein BO221_17260 [Archangium sp. Cb G35]
MDTRDALLHRVTRATPDAFTHGQNQEDILLGLSELYGPAVAEEVQGLVPALVGPGSFNYRVADMLKLCDVAALTAERRTGCPYGEVLEQLAGFSIHRFLESPLGKGMWMMASRDMHEILKWSLASIRSAMTHGQRRYEQLGPGGARIFFQGELMGPAWTRGIFVCGAQRLGRQPISVSVENLLEPGLDFVLRFTW